jgi:serine/threonine protein kinase
VILKKRYRILRKIAQGGMGAVYESMDTLEGGGRRWAVKEMSPAALPAGERTQAIADFRREALILHGLHHPNLPEVRETFEEMGKHFLVMEFIAGRTLLNVLDVTPGFLPEERVMVWARQLLEVIHYLHAQNPPVIYRDVKPANVMLIEGTERLKLIDFGIARFHRQGKMQDTEAFGTAGYAPPEQYGKGQTDQRSDVYAVGATLHHLVTRQDPSLNPFNWVPARRLNSHVSLALENALTIATSLDPARRFGSIEEFAQALNISLPGSRYSRPIAPEKKPPIYTQTARPYVVTAPAVVPPVAAPAQPTIAPTPAPSQKAGATATPARSRSGSKKKGATTTPAQAAHVPIVSTTATGETRIEDADIHTSTGTGVVADPTITPTSTPTNLPTVASPPVPAPVEAKESAPAVPATPAVPAQKPAVSATVLDLGETRWNRRAAKKVNISSPGGVMRGTVLASQPWIAYNPHHFQGSMVTVDVQARRRLLKFGRVKLQVPNLFAIIWTRARKLVPFIIGWFWLLLLVGGALGRTLLMGMAGVVGALLALEGLMWLWAQHVRLLVPAEKINIGRLMVKSSGGDNSIEVKVLARPSWIQRYAGWLFALVLFTIEVSLTTWAILSIFGIEIPLFLP